jgi:ribosomal protein L36
VLYLLDVTFIVIFVALCFVVRRKWVISVICASVHYSEFKMQQIADDRYGFRAVEDKAIQEFCLQL